MDDFIIKIFRILAQSARRLTVVLVFVLLSSGGLVWIINAALSVNNTDGAGVFIGMFMLLFPIYVAFTGHYLSDVAETIISVIDGAVIDWRQDDARGLGASERLMAAVTSNLIKIRIRRAILFAVISIAIYSGVVVVDAGLSLMYAIISAVLILDALLVRWGMLKRRFGLNSFEMLEIITFLEKQKQSGGGPKGGYKELYGREARSNLSEIKSHEIGAIAR